MPGIASCTEPGLEGIKWRLVEMNEAAVALTPETSPTIFLDPTNHKATGFNGCNSYFSNYELNGASLRFGPVATTRRACPDAESVIERNYMDVLDNTDAWQIKDGKLALLSEGSTKVLARFTAESENFSIDRLSALSFYSKVYTAGPVTLKHGEFHAPSAPGSASEVIIKVTDYQVFSSVDDLPMGAVIITTSMGGSGTYYELALLSKTMQGWENSDTVLLGDRIKPKTITIKDNEIIISLLAHGPQDLQCCPTQNITKHFIIQHGHLKSLDLNLESHNGPQFVGAIWQWLQTRYNNDQLAVPEKPENYTIQFMENGSMKIRADCNLKEGEYKVEDQRLTINVLKSTMAMCQPDSLEDQFIKDLSGGTIYFFKEGDLYIDIKYDTGTMKFFKQ